MLLKSLISACHDRETIVFLDSRVSRQSELRYTNTTYINIKSTPIGRLRAEYNLFRRARSSDVVLCFHNLPPLLPSKAKVIVFLQNRLLVDASKLSGYANRTRLRLTLERLWARLFRAHASEYIVQSDSMRSLLHFWHTGNPVVKVMPFFLAPISNNHILSAQPVRKRDFIYIASGDTHKNHRRLFEAWCILAKEGIKPKLTVTLPGRFNYLKAELAELVYRYGLNIEDVGDLGRSAVFELYKSSRTLIFPSLCESFGLPLLEAQHFGLDIVASELDYIRDICRPVETFDPLSPISIARAVKRYLGIKNSDMKLYTPKEFLFDILGQ